VLSARMNYWPGDARDASAALGDPDTAYVSRYALGRDYHKLMRNALQDLSDDIIARVGPMGYRVFVDSGPVLERALARDAGLGWIGKHTNLIARDAGSYFFIGEILTDLPLAVDDAASAHCGTCSACIPACPTGAITAPYRLDARRCISYLTIENKGPIPREFREAIGNRIYGCDDCLAACPWNKFASAASEAKLAAREDLREPPLSELLALDDTGFRSFFSGSPVKRIGRERFVRNVLIAAGNSGDASLTPIVRHLLGDASPLVRGAAIWALSRLLSDREFGDLATTASKTETDATVREEWLAALAAKTD
jgi:epoxyqueuosine reductase